MSSADAPSAAVRTMTPPFFGRDRLHDVAEADALVVVEPARDAEALAARDEDDEAAGERDLGREPRALRLHRVLDGLDEDLLVALQEVLDLAAAAAFELGRDDLVDVEEAVLLEADLDERGLHAREDVVDGALVDVAGDRAALGALEVDLGGPVVLEDGDALLADVDRDEELALGLGKRRPAGRLAAPLLLAATAERWRCAGLRSGVFFSSALGFLRSRRRLPRRQACAGCGRHAIRVGAFFCWVSVLRPRRRAVGLRQVVFQDGALTGRPPGALAPKPVQQTKSPSLARAHPTP